MGYGIDIKCNKCEYTKSELMGIGRMYSPENIIDFNNEFNLLPSLIRSKKTVATIKNLVAKHDARLANKYGHDRYHCHKCKLFYNRFYLHLDYNKGSFEPEYNCTKCQSPLERLDPDAEDKNADVKDYSWGKCPKCEKGFLYEEFGLMINWD